MVVDALHFSRSGGLPAHIGQVDAALFRYAQICDASADMPGPTDTPNLIREARTGRLLPGEGVLPLRELVAALPAGIPLAIEAPVPGDRRSARARAGPARVPGAVRPAG